MPDLRYRIVVYCGGTVRPLRSTPFARFSEAQSFVDKAIRIADRVGVVARVTLEEQSDSAWNTAKSWDHSVVERILAQASQSQTQSETSIDHDRHEKTPQRLRLLARRHRRTRYAAASTGTLILFIISSIFVWQAEGHPIEMMRLLADQRSSEYLPFSAAEIQGRRPAQDWRSATMMSSQGMMAFPTTGRKTQPSHQD